MKLALTAPMSVAVAVDIVMDQCQVCSTASFFNGEVLLLAICE